MSGSLLGQTGPDCDAIVASTQCMEEIFDASVMFYDYLCSEQWEGECNMQSSINRFGTVSIGTSERFTDYNLAVKGRIISEVLRVCKNSPWCDFVFDNEYNLKSLPEIKRFITVNKHLPECTTAKQIENDGVLDIEQILLEQQVKIEEIYLHLFDLNNRIKMLEND